MRRIGVILLAAVLSVFMGNGTDAAGLITIGTGGVTGVYYPAGGTICRLVNRDRQLHGIRCSVESTDGSTYNADAVRTGELDMGLTQSDTQSNALQGKLDFADSGPFKDLRAVFSLHNEPLHLLVRADAGIATFMDVIGKRVNIGNPRSGQRGTVELIMGMHGWTPQTFSLAGEFKSADQSQALCDNKLDAVFFTAGIPNGSIMEAARLCATRIIAMNGPWVDAFVAKNPEYAKAVIPGGTYRGTDRDVETFGTRATLVTSSRLEPAVVYQTVKAVFENFEEFTRMHPAFAGLKKEEMVRVGLTAPLHDGALRYYRETGLR